MRPRHFIRIFAIATLAIATAPATPVAYATDGTVGPARALQLSRARPRVTEILRMLTPWPAENPFPAEPSSNYGHNKHYLTSLARTIAQFEKAWPHGRYFFMGRDVVMLADMMDAFYISNGEPGRVGRVDASGTTFSGAQLGEINGLLRASGIDVDHAREWDRPHVLVDQSAFTATSQSAHLLQAGYYRYSEQGGDVRELVRKLGFLNTFPRADRGRLIDANLDRDGLFEKLESLTFEHGYPPIALTLADQPEKGVLIYTNEWHASFGKLEPQGGGLFVAQPGYASGDATQILADLHAIIPEVAKPEFRARVEAEARALGFELELSSTTCDQILSAAAPRNPSL